MTPNEFKKLAKEYNLKQKKEIQMLQSGITEGKNSNNKILQLTNKTNNK